MKIIKFYTQYCVPCKMMKPIVDKFISDHPEIEYEEIDCTEEVPQEWVNEVKSVPTIIIMKDNKIFNKLIGVNSYNKLESLCY